MRIGDIFICKKCGNEVIVTKVGSGELVCCGKPMIKFTEKYEIEDDPEFEEEEQE